MGKSLNKKARREEARKKAKMKKAIIITIAACAVIVVCATLLNFNALRSNDDPLTKQNNAEDSDVDYNLSGLSSTLISSHINNMWQSPARYMGKTIKADGVYSYMDIEGYDFHMLVISVTDSCCVDQLQFVLDADSELPYPKEGERIEIKGVFDEYEFFGNTYYYLVDAEITA
ncbi:MAG: hypothetical protein FWG70_05080 [Oscillospiraceae bacterium]|nr:hypothetical protein [Oscillospiraceae bacterium]